VNGLRDTDNGVGARPMFGKDEAGHDIVIRRPSDAAEGVRLHNATHQLAHELGAGEIVLPAALVDLESSEGKWQGIARLMVTPHAGAGMEAANHAPQGWLVKVSEEHRLAAALIDLLTRHTDRLPKNLLISSTGAIRLIDQDNTFSHHNPWNHPSAFHPGGVLQYSSPQRSFTDLPEPMQDVVRSLSSRSAAEVAATYGLTVDEARVMRNEARRVERLGLSGAIAEVSRLGLRPQLFHGGFLPAEEHGYHRDGETISARPGQQPGYLVYGPYRRYAPGPLRVTFQLRGEPTDRKGPAARIEIYDPETREMLSSREVSPSELGPQVKEYEVSTHLARERELEFRVYWYGAEPLSVNEIWSR
jgi:hypothetical protein